MPDIDERVIQMEFDNAVFEKKIHTTIRSLGQLKESLKFHDSADGLEELEKTAKKVNLSSIQASVDDLSNKFSLTGVAARTVFSNIVTDAQNCAKKLLRTFSGITTTPMKDGLAEYETQMGAIQTILANTKSKGATIKDVSAALDELNTYADKTIYNFTEMTRNIGTFTAAGVGLQASTQAIKGIANLAAVSGSTSAQASTAMYQLSQALAAGTVKLMDWNSVVNAGMGGEVFQTALKRTAENMGYNVEKIIKKEGSFRESLSSGWLTSAVLTETLAQIAGAYDEASLRAKGYTQEQIAEILDLAKTAEDAATKVKTWAQLIDTLKEALGSGWTKSWEYIFGNFEQAQETFTSISKVLGGIIDRSSTSRNSLLSEWSDLGGRTDLITGIINLFWDLMAVIEVVKRAWSQVFPPVTAEMLAKITKGFRQLTIDLAMDQQTVDSLTAVFNALFSILKLAIKTVSAFIKATKPIGTTLLKIVKYTILLLGYISKSITKATSLVNVSKIAETALDSIKTILYSIAAVLIWTTANIVNFVTSLREIPAVKTVVEGLAVAFQTLYTYGSQKLSGVITVVHTLIDAFKSGTIVQTILNGIAIAITYVCTGLNTLKDFGVNAFNTLIEGIKRIPEIISYIVNAVGSLFSTLSDDDSTTNEFNVSMMSTVPPMKKAGFEFNNLKDTIVNFVKVVHERLSSLDVKQLIALGLGASLVLLVVSLSKLATSAAQAIDGVVNEFKTFNKTITTFFNTLNKTLTSGLNTITTTLNNFGNKLKSSTMVQLVLSLVALAGAVIILAQIPTKDLIPAAGVMIVLSETFVRLVKTTATLGQTSNVLRSNATILLALSASVLIAVKALSTLNGIELGEGLESKFGYLTLLILEVVTFTMILSKWAPKLSSGSSFFVKFTLAIFVMVKSLSKISTIDATQFKDNIGALMEAVLLIGEILLVVYGLSTLLGLFGKKGDSGEDIQKSVAAKTKMIKTIGNQMIKLSVAIGVLAVDMMLFAGAFKVLSYVPITPDLEKSIKTTVLTMIGLTAALSILGAQISTKNFDIKLGKRILKLTLAIGMIAVDLAAFAGVMVLLSSVGDSIKPDAGKRLLKISALVVGLMAALSIFSGAFEKSTGEVGGIFANGNSTSVMLGKHAMRLAASVVLLSGAIAIIANIAKSLSQDYVAYEVGLGVITTIGVIISALMAITAHVSKGVKVAPVLALMGALAGITTALMLLQIYDVNDILGSGLALAACLGGIGLAFEGMVKTNDGKILSQIMTIVEIIALIGSSTAALILLAELPWSGLLAASAALAVVMLGMAEAMKISQSSVMGAAAMTIMIANVLVSALSLKLLAELPWSGILSGSVALAAVMVAAGAAAKIAENMVMGAATMVVMIASMVAAALSLKILAELPWSGLLAAGASLSAVMIAAAFAAKLANESLVGAFAMIPLAASVVILAAAFKSLETVDFEKLLPNLIALGASIGVLAILGAVAGKIPVVAAGMIAVAAAFWIFAKGVEAFGAGANLLASGVEKVVSALERLGNIDAGKVANIQNVILTTLISLGTGIGQGVGAIITGISSAISTGIVQIAVGIATGMMIIESVIVSGITDIGNAVVGFIPNFVKDAATGLVTSVQDFASTIFSAGWSLAEMFEQGFRDMLGWHSRPDMDEKFMADAALGLVTSAVDNEKVANFGGELLGTFFGGGFESTKDYVVDSAEGFIGSIISTVRDKIPDFESLGKSSAGSFISGFIGGYDESRRLASQLAATAALELQIQGLYEGQSAAELMGLGEYGIVDADAIFKNDLWKRVVNVGTDTISNVIPNLDDITGNMSGLANTTDKASKSSKNDAEAKQIQAKYIAYVTSVAQKYAETYDAIDESMGKSTGIESAQAAVERFARAMADANSVDSTTGLEEYKKQFVELYESVVSAVDGIDKFTKVSRSMTTTAPKTYINNLKANSKAITEWGNALQILARKGFSTSIIQKIIDNGVSDVSMFNDFLRASSAEVEEINNGYIDIQNQSFIAADYAMTAMTRAAEMAAERQRMMQEEAAAAQASADAIVDANDQIAENATKTSNKIATTTEFVPQLYTTMVQSIEDTVSSQVNIFEAFSKDFDMTKEDILSNMQSQVAGMYEYQDMILRLNETEISDDLLQYLISLGQDGWGYIKEFTRMSEKEIQEANNAYQQIQDLPQTCATKIADGLSDLRSAFNVPIEQATVAGTDLSQGFANGIDPAAANTVATELGDNSVDALMTALDEHSPSRKTFEAGENFDVGFAQGIESKKNLVIEAIQDLGEAMIDAIHETLDMHSPSRKMFNVGELSDQGLAGGLINGISLVANAAKSVGQSVFDNAKAGLQSYMNIDFNREITPRVTPVYSLAGTGGMTVPVSMGRDNYISSMASSINALRSGEKPSYNQTISVDNSDVVSAIRELRSDIDGLKDSMSNLQVVMDTGATVGALAPGIDRELGKKSTFTKRGN